jgi:uncharacterized repeat protein (TIGR01451 family)
VVLAAIPVAGAPAAEQGRFNLRARITAVVDGDTLNVRLSTGRSDRVRVLGIDAPERGVCYAAEATVRTRALAGGKRVRLIGDARQPTRDRFGRRLAYVTLPNRSDLGRQLLSGGFAKVLVVGRRFTRYSSYLAAENAAKASGAGLWSACVAPADLAITSVDTPDPVAVGTPLTYAVTVTNAGPGRAQSIVLSDTLPAGVTLVSSGLTFSGTGQGSCIFTTTITCIIDALEPGTTVTLTLVVTPALAGTLTNVATVTASTADPQTLNNTVSTTTTVTDPALPPLPPPPPANCHPSYPTVCIPPPPPDLDCGQISFRNFLVIYTVPGPDPHNFDGDRDGVGCES